MLNQQIYNMSDFINPLINIEAKAGTIDNIISGRLMNNQNLFLDRGVSVLSQKNMPLKVKLISPSL
ncbi:hypothetical protein J14TS5_18220 [Paenibacillus lautus]|nr:hypothetical protein J14TS5_18220 [Paenibacillus lautus]